MEKTEEQKQQILKEQWYKRNPCHDKDQNGVDRFWGTVLCVLEDYNKALTLPDVVKPSYCADESYHKIDRCKEQCGGCKEIQSCFKQ